MDSVPGLPRLLGLAGLLPQLIFLAMDLFGPEEWHHIAEEGALAYAALILSFLGGTWWGIAASAPAAERRQALSWVWIASIIPSLVGFAALLWLFHGFTIEPALVSLSGGLIVALAVDARLSALAPLWWLQLRVPLSLGLGLATLAIALF